MRMSFFAYPKKTKARLIRDTFRNIFSNEKELGEGE